MTAPSRAEIAQAAYSSSVKAFIAGSSLAVQSRLAIEAFGDDVAIFLVGVADDEDEVDDHHGGGEQAGAPGEGVVEAGGDDVGGRVGRVAELLPGGLHGRRLVHARPG